MNENPPSIETLQEKIINLESENLKLKDEIISLKKENLRLKGKCGEIKLPKIGTISGH